jgi:hypothetical protein
MLPGGFRGRTIFMKRGLLVLRFWVHYQLWKARGMMPFMPGYEGHG